jgi:hypothetical protein
MIYLASTTGTTFHRPLSLPGQPTPHLFALDNARFDFNSGCTETRYRECLAFTRHSLYLVNASFTMQLVYDQQTATTEVAQVICAIPKVCH